MVTVPVAWPEIPSMTEGQVDRAREVEAVALAQPQVPVETTHTLHGDMYARTVKIPAGVMITGTLIKIPTLLVFDGDALVYTGDSSVRLTGRHVLPAAEHRKQVFVAVADTWLTMLFPSDAKSVKDAEEQFTDEGALLASRREGNPNRINISGEISCQALPQPPLSQE